MTIEELERKVSAVIDSAVEAAELDASARSIAERILHEELDLMWELKNIWALERLTFRIGRRIQSKREKKRAARLGVEHTDPVLHGLPGHIFLRDGTRPTLDYCRLGEIEEHLTLLRSARGRGRRRNPARIAQIEAAIEILRKWAATKPGICWLDALYLEVKERARIV